MIETENPIVAMREIELRPLKSSGELVPLETETPAPHREFFVRRNALLLATFVLPVAAAAVYLFLIASDRYVAEAKFVIRSASSNGYESIASMVSSQGSSRATDETYAVNEYIMSRDAMDRLLAEKRVGDALSRPEADFINRFPNFYSRNNKEEMFRVYKRMVSAYVDGGTSISNLEVVAFRAADARDIATALLGYAEDLINRLNDRAHQDALAYTNAIVERARRDLSDIQTRLTAYRNSSGMVDTTRELASALDAIARMAAEVAQIEATIAQQQALTPSSPATSSLREKAQSYRDEMSCEKLLIVGRDSSMATKLGAFEQLVLEREIAAKALASAENNRDRTRQEAEQQHLYLQVIVAPNMPDQAKYPRRFLYFFATGLTAFAVYLSCRAFVDSAMEHA